MTEEEEELKKRKRCSSDDEDDNDRKIFKSSDSPIKEETSSDEGIVEDAEFKLPKFDDYLNDFKIPSNINSEASTENPQDPLEIQSGERPSDTTDTACRIYYCKFCTITTRHPFSIKRHLQKSHRDVIKPEDFEVIYTQILNDGKTIESTEQFFEMQIEKPQEVQKEAPEAMKTKSSYQIKTITTYTQPTQKPKFIRSRKKRDKIVECPKCGKTFVQLAYWRKHVLKCAIEPDYECKFCDVKSYDSTIILKHVINQHGNQIKPGEFQSIYQDLVKGRGKSKVLKGKRKTSANKKSTSTKKKKGKVSKRKEIYILSESTSKIRMFCESCNEFFDTFKDGKKIHIPNCPKCQSPVQGECPKCKKLYTSYKSTRLHVEFVCDPQNIFSCNDCDYQTQNKMYIKHHVHKYHFETDVNEHAQCPKCAREFKNGILRELHKKHCTKRTSKGKFTCPLCYRQYNQKCDLRRHMRSIHPDGKHANFRCKLCPFEAQQKFILIRHRNQEHIGEYEKIESKFTTIPKNVEVQASILADKIEMYCEKCDKLFPTIVNGKRTIVHNCLDCKTELQGKCPKCKNLYKSYSTTKTHIEKVCNPCEQYKCNECNYVTNNKVYLKYHSVQQHLQVNEQDQVECERCKRKFKTLDIKRQHLKTCETNKMFRCDFCNIRFKTKKIVRKHIWSYHMNSKVQNFKCKYCDFEVEHKYNLTKHIMRYHSNAFTGIAEAKLFCVKCVKAFDVIKENNKRIILDSCPACQGPLKGQCSKCKKLCKTYKTTRMHIQNFCDPIVSLTCEYCNHKIPNQRQLKEHIERMHLNCNGCKKKFKTADLLQVHLSECKMMNVCEYCKRNFPSKQKLEAHIERTHLSCTRCKEIFETSELQQKHLLICNKGLLCKYCSNRYQTESNLNAHIDRSHLTCKLCKEKFKTIELQQEHLLTCTKKDFSCEHCPRTFTSQNYLKNHVGRMHLDILMNIKTSGTAELLEKPSSECVNIACEYCKHEFETIKKLKEHIGRMHLNLDKPGKRTGTVKKPQEEHVQVSKKKIKEKKKKNTEIYNCDQCSLAFREKTRLAEHISFVHMGVEEPFHSSTVHTSTDSHLENMESKEMDGKELDLEEELNSLYEHSTKDSCKDDSPLDMQDKSKSVHEPASKDSPLDMQDESDSLHKPAPKDSNLDGKITDVKNAKKPNVKTKKKQRPTSKSIPTSRNNEKAPVPVRKSQRTIKDFFFAKSAPTEITCTPEILSQSIDGLSHEEHFSEIIETTSDKENHLEMAGICNDEENISDIAQTWKDEAEDITKTVKSWWGNGSLLEIAGHWTDSEDYNEPFCEETKEQVQYLSCKFCSREFPGRRSLASHIVRMHDDVREKPVSKVTRKPIQIKPKLHSITENKDCNICGKKFLNRGALTTHMKYMHTAAATKEHYRKLLATVKEDPPSKYTCNYCGIQIAKRDYFTYHLRKRHIHEYDDMRSAPKKSFQCEDCDREFLKRNSLFLHVKSRHWQRYITMKASMSEEQKKLLIKEDEPSEYFCDGCGRGYKQRRSLIKHLNDRNCKVKKEPKALVYFNCTVCDRRYWSKKSLKAHWSQRHDEEKKKLRGQKNIYNFKEDPPSSYTCYYCQKQVKHRKSIMYHIQKFHIHEIDPSKKPRKTVFKCKKCPAHYTRHNLLQLHMKHRHRYTYYLMKAKEGISKKMKSHIIFEDAPVHGTCHYCGDKFNYSALVNHIREEHFYEVHSEGLLLESSFKCQICGIRFMNKGALSTHIKYRHNGVDVGAVKDKTTATEDSEKKEAIGSEGGLGSRMIDYSLDFRKPRRNESLSDGRRLRWKSPKKALECKICRRKFFNKAIFTNHVKFEHEEKFVLNQQPADITSVENDVKPNVSDIDLVNLPVDEENVEKADESVMLVNKVDLEEKPTDENVDKLKDSFTIPDEIDLNEQSVVNKVKKLNGSFIPSDEIKLIKQTFSIFGKSNESMISKDKTQSKKKLTEKNSGSKNRNHQFPRRSELSTHTKHRHSDISNKNSITSNKENVDKLNKSVIIKSELLSCQYCYEKFTNKNELDAHTKIRHKINNPLNFKCKLCNFETDHKRGLIFHMKHSHAMNIDAFSGLSIKIKNVDELNREAVERVTTVIDDSEKENHVAARESVVVDDFENLVIEREKSVVEDCKEETLENLVIDESKNEIIINDTSNSTQKSSPLKSPTEQQPVEINHIVCPSEEDSQSSVISKSHCTKDEKKFNGSLRQRSTSRARSIANTSISSVTIVREIYRQPRVFNCDYCYNQYYARKSLIKHIHSEHMTQEGELILPKKCPHCFYETKCQRLFDRHALKHTKQKSVEKEVKEVVVKKKTIIITPARKRRRMIVIHTPGTNIASLSKISGANSSIGIKVESPMSNRVHKKHSTNVPEQSSKNVPENLPSDDVPVVVSETVYVTETFERDFKTPKTSNKKSVKSQSSSRKSSAENSQSSTSQNTLRRKLFSKSKAKEESNSEKYFCDNCNYETKRRYNLIEHIRRKHSVHSESKSKCSKCGKGFRSKTFLEKHIPICQISFDYQCTFCSMKTKHNTHMKRHLMNLHPKIIEDVDQVYRQIIRNRKECIEKFRKGIAEEKSVPVKQHPAENIKYYCDKCEETFLSRENNKKIHLEKCPNCATTVQSKCVSCNKLFESYQTAYYHVTVICKPRSQFVCSRCKHVAKTRRDLQRHIQRKHTKLNPKNFFKCSKCIKTYKNESSRNRHEKTCH